jgi:hypothetical protein
MLYDIIPEITKLYINNIGIKGPKTYYNYKEVVPGIRYYILEYIRNLDITLK